MGERSVVFGGRTEIPGVKLIAAEVRASLPPQLGRRFFHTMSGRPGRTGCQGHGWWQGGGPGQGRGSHAVGAHRLNRFGRIETECAGHLRAAKIQQNVGKEGDQEGPPCEHLPLSYDSDGAAHCLSNRTLQYIVAAASHVSRHECS